MALQPPALAIVLSHGSYHTPETYQPFLAALKTQHIEGHCPQLPTSDLTKLNVGDPASPDFNREPPLGGYPQPADDVVVLDSLLRRLIIDEGKNVLLIGHSSGGASATAAAIPELQAKHRRPKNLSGGIVGIFYECAFLIPVGESVDSFFQPKGSPPVVPPFCQIHDQGFEGLMSAHNGAHFFFNGIDKQAAEYYEATLTASPVLRTVLTNDAYTALPCAYVLTENDLALPVAYQEQMVQLQTAREGVRMDVYRLACGHSPHLACVDQLVANVKDFAQKVIG